MKVIPEKTEYKLNKRRDRHRSVCFQKFIIVYFNMIFVKGNLHRTGYVLILFVSCRARWSCVCEYV
jgi:hypothetical protein